MYHTAIFERAAKDCACRIIRLFYSSNNQVRKAEGFVRMRRKRTIDGKVKKDKYKIKVRWDAMGYCFRAKDNSRLPKFDLPLQSISESIQREEYESCMSM